MTPANPASLDAETTRTYLANRRVSLKLGFPSESGKPVRLWHECTRLTPGGSPEYVIWELQDRALLLKYIDGTQFILSRDGSEVWANWPATSTFESTAGYLLGPTFGLVLHLRGIPTVHASAIAMDGKALLFVGGSGTGKSVTAAAFATLGHAVLSDDIVELITDGDRLLVQSGFPFIRLWPDGVELLFGSRDALSRLTPTWDKRYLDLTQPRYEFQGEPLPLGAVYFLSERIENAAAALKAISMRQALLQLIVNSFTGHLPSGKMRKVKEFRTFSQIVGNHRVVALHPSANPKAIRDTCELITADFRRHCSVPTPN